MIKLVLGWGDVAVAAGACVYVLVEVFSIKDLSALAPERAQQLTIIFAASLFYVLVRLAWKGIQRYLRNQELDNN
ncbi:MAG: hypothetical protein O3A85_01270 [Proteobacteria bacterium]|nr:hypothetical protein [Pseudomonadota bacterium]